MISKKSISLMTLFLSLLLLFSFPVYATNEENQEVANTEIAEVVVEKTEEELKREEALAKLEIFKTNFNQAQETDVAIYNISVVDIPVPIGEPTIEKDEQGNEIVVPPTETENVLSFGQIDSIVYFGVKDLEFELWMEEIASDVAKDALKGLEALKDTDVTIDHIKMDHWGEFFEKYNVDSLTKFPSGDIVIEYGDYKFVIENSKESKRLILEYFIPIMKDAIREEAKAFPVKRYALDISSGSLLKDYVCDLTSVREVATVYPFDGVENFIFANAGDYVGLSLGKEYVEILRGYVEDGNGSYNRRVEGTVPGCVNVLSYITLIRNISGNTISDKTLSDFTIYQNLAVRLDTKELIDTTDMTTTNKTLLYPDYKLDPNTLILAPISDDVVIIQPTYLECFFYNNYNKGLNRIVDITPFVSTGEPYFTVTPNIDSYSEAYAGSQQVPVSYFCDSNGVLDTKLGQAPFLIYYSSHTPYDLMLNWAFNLSSGHFVDSSEQDAFVNMIKDEMLNAGLKEDYDTYTVAAGQMKDSTKTILKVSILVVILIVVIILVIVIRKKLKASNVTTPGNSNLLFDDYDNNDDDDGDFGDFELK